MQSCAASSLNASHRIGRLCCSQTHALLKEKKVAEATAADKASYAKRIEQKLAVGAKGQVCLVCRVLLAVF